MTKIRSFEAEGGGGFESQNRVKRGDVVAYAFVVCTCVHAHLYMRVRTCV